MPKDDCDVELKILEAIDAVYKEMQEKSLVDASTVYEVLTSLKSSLRQSQ